MFSKIRDFFERYLFLILAGLWAISLVWALWYGGKTTAAKYEIQIAKANNEAFKQQQLLQGEIDEINKKSIMDLNTVIVQRDLAIARLRERPTRADQAARANCKGSTGAELSREDGEFLEREAARAEILRQALKGCYAYADKLQE